MSHGLLWGFNKLTHAQNLPHWIRSSQFLIGVKYWPQHVS